jgi:hypothetical protein
MSELVYSNELLKIVVYGDLFCTYWLGKGTADDVRATFAHKAKLRETLGGKQVVSMIIVTAPAVTKPTGEVDAELKRVEKATVGWHKAEVLAIVATGLAASLLRGLTTGVLLVRADHPRKVLSSVAEACAWAAAHVTGPSGARVTGDELRRVLNSAGCET